MEIMSGNMSGWEHSRNWRYHSTCAVIRDTELDSWRGDVSRAQTHGKSSFASCALHGIL